MVNFKIKQLTKELDMLKQVRAEAKSIINLADHSIFKKETELLEEKNKK